LAKLKSIGYWDFLMGIGLTFDNRGTVERPAIIFSVKTSLTLSDHLPAAIIVDN
jgi:hypothetical protein